MFEFFTAVFKVFENPSKKTLAAFFGLLILFSIGWFMWERWTASNRLTKLERASTILEHVSKVNPAETNQVVILSGQIIKELAGILGKEQAPAPKHSFILRLLLGFSPWFVLSLCFAPGVIRKGKSEAGAVLGAWCVGGIIAFIGAFLPEGQWPWQYLLIYPGLSFLIFTVLMIVIAVIASKKQKPEGKEGQEANR